MSHGWGYTSAVHAVNSHSDLWAEELRVKLVLYAIAHS